MPLADSHPLRELSCFLEAQNAMQCVAVPVRLAEPMWGTLRPSRADFLAGCLQLQLLLERAAPTVDSATLTQMHAVRIRSLAAAANHFATQDRDDDDGWESEPLPYMESSRLSTVFPLVARELGSNPEELDTTATGMNDILDHLTSLNQLLAIATQLREDARARSFKYAAHKLALLYQAINLSKLKRDVFRKRIEEHFEHVKAATETNSSMQLSPMLTNWLVTLCEDVIAQVRAVPPSVPQKLGAPLIFLQRRVF